MPIVVPKLCVVSSLNFSERGRCFYKHQLFPRLNLMFEVLDPCRTEKKFTDRYEFIANAIVGSQLVLAVLDYPSIEVDIQRAVAAAAIAKVAIEGYADDLRIPGYGLTVAQAKARAKAEAIIGASGGQVSSDLESLIEILRRRSNALFEAAKS
jgi:hypothetical protein